MSANKRQAAAEVFNQQNIFNEQLDDNIQRRDEYFANEDQVQMEKAASMTLAGGIMPITNAAPAGMPMPAAPMQQATRSRGYGGPQDARKAPVPMFSMKTSEELQLEKEPIQVRVTGTWLWKRVIVPPNAYVVHTRLGRKEPVTLGLGVSFRYNPYTDAYLVVPAAMQTIGVVANSITREKQGINVLAYVQWQISDFSVAYRKLDITDPRDPLGIVNAQLREQAEAAIKDKIATMSVEDVLTDKAPIIEELTRRLSEVTEGRYQREGSTNNEGLGIKIVTVQLKEARVSSQRLWENLQAPYRYEQEKSARISYLQMQEEIRTKELETRKITETSEAEAKVEIERITQSKETEALELRLAEEEKRFAREQTNERQRIQQEEETTRISEESERRLEAERARQEQQVQLAALEREQEAEIARARSEAEREAQKKALQVEQRLKEITEDQRLALQEAAAEQERLQREAAFKQAEHAFLQQTQALEAEREQAALLERLLLERQTSLARLELQDAANQSKFRQQELEAQVARLYQEVRNLANERDLERLFIEKLPALAEQMPEIHEMRVIQSGEMNQFNSFVSGLMVMLETLRNSLHRETPPQQ